MTRTASPASSSIDRHLNILKNGYRRRLLVALLEHNPQLDDDPQMSPFDTVSDETMEALRVQIHHTHLPKLEATELIERDRETNAVRKGPRFDEIRPLLVLLCDHSGELPGV